MDLSWEPTGYSSDKDTEYVNSLRARPDDVIVATVDVANGAQIDAAYEETMAKWGTCDVVINDAAMRQRILYPPTGRITTLETSDEDWERAFAVNVFGALKVTRRFIQPMVQQRSGSIISIISSGALHHSYGGAYKALRPNSREMPYQSTKSALLTMMFYLADEIRSDNVAVNVMIPGHTRTTGFDEQNIARRELGMGNRNAPLPLRADHMVPLALFTTEDGHLYVEGAGPPVVFVHGNPSWSFEFRHLIKGLRAEFRCIAPDHIGFGLSSHSKRRADRHPAAHAERPR